MTSNSIDIVRQKLGITDASTSDLSGIGPQAVAVRSLSDPLEEALTSTPSLAIKNDAAVTSIGLNNVLDTLEVFTQATDAADEISDILSKIAELADVAQNYVTSTPQREALNTETQDLLDYYSSIITNVKVNGQPIMNGSTSSVQVFAGGALSTVGTGNATPNFSIATESSTVQGLDLTTRLRATNSYNVVVSTAPLIEGQLEKFEASSDRLGAAVDLLSKRGTLDREILDSIENYEAAENTANAVRESIAASPILALEVHSKLSTQNVQALLGGE